MDRATVERSIKTCGLYGRALSIFLASRLVVLAAIAFAARYVPQATGEGLWDESDAWYHYLLRFDAGWYLRIAKKGYEFTGNTHEFQPVVFYPLYPLICRATAFIFQCGLGAASLIASNLLALGGIILFFELARRESGERAAYWAVALLSFFATSFFFSSAYTESLALVLISAFFLALKRQRFWVAALMAGLCTATRSTGVVLVLPLAWEYFTTRGIRGRRQVLELAAILVVATSGLLLFMAYLGIAFNDPLVFAKGQQAWGKDVGLINRLVTVVTLQPFSRLSAVFRVGVEPRTLEPWVFLLFFVLTVTFIRKLGATFALYCLGVLLLPYVSIGASIGFQSFTRYSMLAIPIFMVVGDAVKEREWIGVSLVGLSAAMLFFYMALFAQWYFVV